MKQLWIARDEGYNLYLREPSKDDYRIDWWTAYDEYFSANEFESLTGIKLKPGQFCKIKVEQVGDVWELT